jgi:hypothetical protein
MPWGQLAQIGEELASVDGDVVQDGRRRATAAVQLVTGQPQPGEQSDDALLHSVMQVAFDAPPLGVGGRDDPRPGSGQLLEPWRSHGGVSAYGLPGAIRITMKACARQVGSGALEGLRGGFDEAD